MRSLELSMQRKFLKKDLITFTYWVVELKGSDSKFKMDCKEKTCQNSKKNNKQKCLKRKDQNEGLISSEFIIFNS